MSYGVSETSAIRITRVIEDTLIGSGKFGGVSKSMLTLNEAIIDVKKG